MKSTTTFPGLLEAFFTDRLMRQRQASPATIASYRDAFRLLFQFAQDELGESPSALRMEDLDSPFIVDFLCWLEEHRGNSARTRNARLAAIHSFFKYAALQDPVHSALIQRVLAIPGKRYEKNSVAYLTRTESEALLNTPDTTTRNGRRDQTLLIFMVQTGLRVSEVVGLNCEDAVLETGPHVRCRGKGRKERCTPLSQKTVCALRNWMTEREGRPSDPLFPNARGRRLSRDGVEYLLRKHVTSAARGCASLARKAVSPHVLRHTAAMELLNHGVDRSVIALWLGHETLETVNIYVHASMQLKEQALEKATPPDVALGRYRPDDELLAFLNSL